MAKREGEFPYEVWKAVMSREVCEECEYGLDENDPFQVHHKIFLASVAAKQFPLAALRSIANAQLLHTSCHNHIHNVYDEPPQEVVQEVAGDWQEIQEQERTWLRTYQERKVKQRRLT